MDTGASSVVSTPPVPAPRSKQKPANKPPPPVKLPVSNNVNPVKPDVPTKPKISPKPSLATKPSTATSPSKELSKESKEHETIYRKSRPLSVKVTDDGVHNKVANELASILGRPRSSSKGLLSPTSYSAPQSVDVVKLTSSVGSTESGGSTPPVSPPQKSPPKPVPRPRHSVSSVDEVLSPTSPTAVTPFSTVRSTPSAVASPTPTTTTIHKSSQPPPDVQATKPAKPKPSRPPPPSVKRPPPPQRPPQKPPAPTQTSNADKAGVNGTLEDNNDGSPTTDQGIPDNRPTKKKLEITVLGARPMSEVGFRDVKSQSAPSQLVADKVEVGTILSDTSEQRTSLSTQQISSNSRAAATANLALKTDSTSPANKTSTPVDKPSNGTSIRKPTIIRPGRRPGNTDTDSLVSKESSKSVAAQSAGRASKPQVLSTVAAGSPATQRKDPPKSLSVKKDPWNQIAKGPGPTDNLAFSTGDTPPPKSQGLTLLTSVASQEASTAAENPDKPIDSIGKLPKGTTKPDGSPKPTRTIMDQSLDNTTSDVLQPESTSPESASDSAAEPTMFFHNPSTEAPHTTSKPSALQRIYEAKKAREEKQPEKYKHRPDCYVDKPNIDVGFWKFSANSSDTDPYAKDGSSDLKKSEADNASSKHGSALIAYAAFAYKGTVPTDLSLKAGQEVKVTAKLDSEWLYGEADGKTGTFPALYVSVSEDDIDALPMHKTTIEGSQSSNSAGASGTALYDFTAEHDSELSLKAGDNLVNVEPVNAEWSMGKISNRSGLFPTSFVELHT